VKCLLLSIGLSLLKQAVDLSFNSIGVDFGGRIALARASNNKTPVNLSLFITFSPNILVSPPNIFDKSTPVFNSLVFDDCICFKGYAVKLTAEIRVRRVCGYRSHSLKVGSLQLAMQSGVNSTGELNIDCRCYHIDGKDQFLRDAASCSKSSFIRIKKC